jgi:hypothetical protein
LYDFFLPVGNSALFFLTIYFAPELSLGVRGGGGRRSAVSIGHSQGGLVVKVKKFAGNSQMIKGLKVLPLGY